MPTSMPTIAFDSPHLCEALQSMSQAELDELPFGVIGFDAPGVVVRYNAYESKAATFEIKTVLGQNVFTELAPCLNNYLVSGRFEEAAEHGQSLDESMPYVLTFRMRPTRVRLRLLSNPGSAIRFVLVLRAQGGSA
jgi:photoactive yellow protein